MEEMIERNYEAVKKRGKIDAFTTEIDFLNKMKEELAEFENAVLFESKENRHLEAADLAAVCINYLKNEGVDQIKMYEKITIKNETRND